MHEKLPNNYGMLNSRIRTGAMNTTKIKPEKKTIAKIYTNSCVHWAQILVRRRAIKKQDQRILMP